MEELKKVALVCKCDPKNNWCSCVPERELLIGVSGGEYEAFWNKNYLCPRDIDLKDLKEKLEKTEFWGSAQGSDPDTTLRKLGCIHVFLEPKITFHKGYDGKLEVEH